MNLLHLKYVVEVARIGSINKAAEALFIAQPNLSRAIRDLETDLGITIFNRTAKGIALTPEGEEFVGYAKSILTQIDSVENLYKNGIPIKQRFSISVPRATYISDAFANFAKEISTDSAEIFYKETNSSRTIKNVLSDEYQLGIVRYADNHDADFKAMFEDKGLTYEMVSEFHYVLVMQKNCPLASLPEIHFKDLEDYIEIAHADPYVPSLSVAQVKKEELPDNIKRRIFVFERASQFDLLCENENVFMWVSPMPQKILDRHGLIQRECGDNNRTYRDVLIYKKEHKLSDLENKFITQVCISKRKYL